MKDDLEYVLKVDEALLEKRNTKGVMVARFATNPSTFNS